MGQPLQHQWQPGDIARVTGYSAAQSGRVPLSVSTYRVDAVKHGRCYVTHLTGPRHQHGVNGWTNLWFDADDASVERVDG